LVFGADDEGLTMAGNITQIDPADSPSKLVATSKGVAVSPAWDQRLDQMHENAHQSLVGQRANAKKAGQVGYIDAQGQGPGQMSADQQAFASVPRPPDTQSY
jgi:hypothetical protein